MRSGRTGSPLAAALLAVAALSAPASGQSADVSLSFAPGVSIPIGPTVDGDIVAYSLGGGGSLKGELVPGFARFLFGRLSIDYDYLPLNNAGSGMSLVAGGGSVGASFSPNPRVALRASAGGGLYMATLGDGSIRNPFVEGGGDVLVRLGPSVSVGLGGRYKHLFLPEGELYRGVSVQLALSYDLAGSRKGTDIRLEPDLGAVFPLFYSYYDKNPLGTVTLRNDESLPLDKVKVSFFAKQYMDAPRVSAEFRRIAAGERREVPVYALFNDAIFRVTEGAKAAGDLIVEYYYLGRHTVKTVPVTLDVQNRNAMTWDDDRKAAAFVTAKDPVVLGFAKSLSSMVRADKGAAAVSLEFRTALGVFQALGVYGLGYTIDPSTPFASTSGSETAVDFLQFPNQTMAYRAGDCDDLTVLYCSLLEAVGVATAFVTTPGHIFAAFDTGLDPDNAARMFSEPGSLIVKDGAVWIPVEVTVVKDGFVRAWAVGARQWRDAAAAGSEGFYPVRDAWKLYAPVGFSDAGIGVTLPPPERLASAYHAEMARFSRSQVGPRVAELQAQLRTAREPEKVANRLGILYAQYGLLSEAREQFAAAVKKAEFAPALINLGNVEYLGGDMKKAGAFYARALEASPGSYLALLGLARTAQADGNQVAFQDAVASLRAINPDAVGRYFPSEGAARASGIDDRRVDQWNE